MANRLIDDVKAQELETRTTTRSSAVKKITIDNGSKDKQISAKVNKEVFKQFTDINRAQGLSNNSALNMLISKYVRENKGILNEDI